MDIYKSLNKLHIFNMYTHRGDRDRERRPCGFSSKDTAIDLLVEVFSLQVYTGLIQKGIEKTASQSVFLCVFVYVCVVTCLFVPACVFVLITRQPWHKGEH